MIISMAIITLNITVILFKCGCCKCNDCKSGKTKFKTVKFEAEDDEDPEIEMEETTQ